MARYPEAEWRPLNEDDAYPITPRIAVVHTMVGTLDGTDSYFRQDGQPETHFGVGDGQGRQAARVYQWVDTSRRAEAQSADDDIIVSIETEDRGHPERPWTDLQVDALVDVLAWLCRTHDIPPRLADGHRGRGIGYHRQYAPWADKDSDPEPDKSCPGDTRIRQLKRTVIPRVQDELAGDRKFDVAVMTDGNDVDTGPAWMLASRWTFTFIREDDLDTTEVKYAVAIGANADRIVDKVGDGVRIAGAGRQDTWRKVLTKITGEAPDRRRPWS